MVGHSIHGSWPQIVQARIDRHDAAGIALDDPVTFAVAGATVLTAVVTAINPNYRHRQIDVAPAILRHLALDTIDAIPEGTSQQRVRARSAHPRR